SNTTLPKASRKASTSRARRMSIRPRASASRKSRPKRRCEKSPAASRGRAVIAGKPGLADSGVEPPVAHVAAREVHFLAPLAKLREAVVRHQARRRHDWRRVARPLQHAVDATARLQLGRIAIVAEAAVAIAILVRRQAVQAR